MGPCKTHDYKGSIPWSSTSFRIVTANKKANYGCLATKAILFIFVPGLCNGSTTDFDSVSLGSIPSPGAMFFALLSLMVEVLFCNQGVWVRFLQGAPSFVRVLARERLARRLLRRAD